jgi:hypothetical protein
VNAATIADDAPSIVEPVVTRRLAKRPTPFRFEESPVNGTPANQGSRWQGRSSTAPHLWPDRARSEGMMHILRHTAKFLIEVGWWPTKRELAGRMRATLYAVDWYAAANVDAGSLTIDGRYKKQRLNLTLKGWSAVGKEPVAPWQKPPSESRRRRLSDNVTREVMREIKRAQEGNNG